MYKGILDGMNAGYLNEQLITYDKKGYQVVKNAKKYPLNNYDVILKDKSLKQLEGFMGDMIKETSVPFDKVEPLTQEEIKEIITYNIHDVKEDLKVLDNLLDDFNAQLDIMEMYSLDNSFFNNTKVQLAAKVLDAVSQHTLDDEFDIIIPPTIQISEKYQHVVDWFLNPKNWTYKEHLHSEDNQHSNQYNCIIAGLPHVLAWGGIHGSDDNSIYEGLILAMDVSSQYPTIDIEYDLLSRKVKDPNKFREMRDFRLELKSKKDRKNKSLKPLINGVYGAGKDRNNPLYDPRQANLTCVFGQLFILDLIDKVEPYCKLIQSNTDGIYVLCENREAIEKVKSVAKEWEKRTRLELEYDEYSKIIQKDVNNYIMIDSNGHYKSKGAYVKALSPIDYDLPILNKALINYFVYDIPVEKTINEETELIEFQKIIKLTSLYKEVIYGEGKKIKVGDKDRITVSNGTLLKEKVHRVFASNRPGDKGIYKSKIEKGEKCYEKVAYTPDRCFINNDDIHGVKVPDYLDRQYYIDAANDRIKQFLTKEEVKVDETPNVLFKCMCESEDFYTFLKKCKENGITKKVLEGYLIADCCNSYGKTKKLLTFRNYFEILYGKEKMTVGTLNKKISDETIKNIIIDNAEETKSGKSYTNLNYEKALKEIFNLIPDEHINPYEIMSMQVSKFNTVRYVDDTLSGNRWFVLNTRNVIAPNIIIYNMTTGEIQYRKVQKEVYRILPLQDGDIIDVLKSEKEFGKKIIGKDDNGINIIAADIDKEYDVITQYEIVYRNYSKSKNLLSDSEEY